MAEPLAVDRLEPKLLRNCVLSGTELDTAVDIKGVVPGEAGAVPSESPDNVLDVETLIAAAVPAGLVDGVPVAIESGKVDPEALIKLLDGFPWPLVKEVDNNEPAMALDKVALPLTAPLKKLCPVEGDSRAEEEESVI